MCSFFSQRMENDHGNLADMIRASSSTSPTTTEFNVADWSFTPDHDELVNLQPSMDGRFEDFGSPSMNFHQPLLQELAGMPLIGSPETPVGLEMGPCNIFSRVLQMDPGSARVSTRAALQPSPVVVGGGASSQTGAMISSPRTPGTKRRKGQARKVICVPAPAATSSKSSGEVVPSDLWAWRKYGQKPIKGSPYPRGYYRCSSSKGCSARKQVERSRSDPNMLVITYTSEHNHPWPTQRNSLAGSTRSQPAKNNSSTSNNGSQIQRPASKEETKAIASSVTPVKEEVAEIGKEIDAGFDHVFQHDYQPLMSELNPSDDFFTDLGELEADPMDLNFTQGLLDHKTDDQIRGSKDLDHFSFFDWAGNSFGEAKDGL